MPSLDSLHCPDLTPSLSSVESLRNSLPQEHQPLFDTLRKEVMDFCDLHHIPTSSLNNHEALRESTKHLSIPDLTHLSLVLARLEYLVTHKEPMPEEEANMTEERAREIMGRNFLGTREVEQHFGELSPEQEEALSIIPFSKETLEECSQTHILVADIGISLLAIRQNVKIPKDKKLFYEQDWYEYEEFVERIEVAHWRLIRKTPVEDSFEKTWDEQRALINQETDEIPSARQAAYMVILHFLVTEERLFETCLVRTSDIDSLGNHVYVGLFDGSGLSADCWDHTSRYSDIGVASSRKVL